LLAETEQVTTIIIAHRISSVIHADQIIVLDDGQIVEIGTHATLLTNKGFYSELYQKQMIDQEKPVNP
jgi:ABC-type multidrug transport system fused ATPase/permease subunit